MSDSNEIFDAPTADRRADLFGGNGTVAIWNLLGRQAAPPFEAVIACELEPSGHVGTHLQQQCDEIIVCLEGDGIVAIQGGEQPLRPGTVAYLQQGKTLSIRNPSDTPLRYLIIKAARPR
jgi:quercetin dioxygenase-like cupin family protein